MEVTHRYAGSSGAIREGDEEKISFSPDLLREPTFFVGQVSNHVNFREAISTLHHVVTSDLRFQPKDRTEYMAWLDSQKETWLAEAANQGKDAAEKLKAARAELGQLNEQSFKLLKPFRQARGRYWKWGFTASTDMGQEVFEQKIDLPDSWVRGFLQVSSAMALPAHRVTLHPMDIHNLCFALKSKKERRSPRSLRFNLKPGQPPEMIFEPWETRIPCPRAVYHGGEDVEIRMWGRRRLLILERLIPIARSFDLYLLGNGMPAFVVADLGPMSFTLGLSGWTANDWSRTGQFDLLAPRKRIGKDTREKVFAALAARWLADEAELAAETGLDRTEVSSALTILAQHGRAMYDLDKKLWRYRDVVRDPLDFESMRFQSDEEAKADRLIVGGMVEITKRDTNTAEGRVTDDGRDQRVTIEFDTDERLVHAHCGCDFHRMNALRKGPCEHILALRRLVAEGEMPSTIIRGPWEGGK